MSSEEVMSETPTPLEIPIVDFAKWKPECSSEERMEVATALVMACRNVGFAYIQNHGVSEERLAEAFAWSKKLFDLSQDDKQKAPHPPGASIHRGYSSPGLEKVSQATSEKDDPELAKKLRQIVDHKESYDMGSDQNEEQPNVWIPEEVLPGLRKFMLDFYWECFEVSNNILRAISLGIGLDDEDYLLQYHSGHNNQLRLLHYPPLPAAWLEAQKYARMPSHTDWSTLTFLFQDDCGGLEVEDINHPGHYIPATPIKGSIIMNVGDLLQRWTNDQLRSTYHRVTLPPLFDRFEGVERMIRERFSIPYFVAPDPSSLIQCLSPCLSEGKPASYLPITQRDYNRLRSTPHYESAATESGGGKAY